MTTRFVRKLCISVAAAALAACGGGGERPAGSVAPPPPPPAPTSPNPAALIPGVTGTQQFATRGVNLDYETLQADPTDAGQLQVRYDASAMQYEVALPSSAEWYDLGPHVNGYSTASGVHTHFADTDDYSYSAIAQWEHYSDTGGVIGAVAIGVPTPAAAVPVTGTATYEGQLLGRSNERVPDNLVGPWPAYIGGSISLAFDFAGGSLAGSISPVLNTWNVHELPALSFTDTVYSTGSPAFSGRFETALAGPNGFSGLLTGPNAQELLGNFQFPYLSPEDGLAYSAGGAFIGRRP